MTYDPRLSRFSSPQNMSDLLRPLDVLRTKGGTLSVWGALPGVGINTLSEEVILEYPGTEVTEV